MHPQVPNRTQSPVAVNSCTWSDSADRSGTLTHDASSGDESTDTSAPGTREAFTPAGSGVSVPDLSVETARATGFCVPVPDVSVETARTAASGVSVPDVSVERHAPRLPASRCPIYRSKLHAPREYSGAWTDDRRSSDLKV